MYAYHHSQKAKYRMPFGAAECNKTVTLRLLTDSPVAEVRCWYHGQEIIYPMERKGDLFEVQVSMPAEPGLFWYYFRLHDGYCYGNNEQRLGGEGALWREEPPSYQITVYPAGLTTPAWFCESVVYQIFPDRFFRSGGKEEGLLPWDTPIPYDEQEDSSEQAKHYFYGGDLAGIKDKLSYLRELGVTALYLNPIFKAFSNHRYDTADYLQIDPLLGDEKDFSALCKEIPVILDGVFNHTGADSIYFNKYGTYPEKGACQGADSPYYSWYSFMEFPYQYESWWGIPTLPSIRKSCPDFQRFITEEVLKKWLRLGAKGFRLDVADELSDEMLRKIYAAVKEEDKENVIVGEVWEDASNKISYGKQREYFCGNRLDGVMNYPFKDWILALLLRYITAYDFGRLFMSLTENYPAPCLRASMSLLGSHDVMRVLSVLGEAPNLPLTESGGYRLPPEKESLAKKRLRLAVLLQMTLIGVPTIYYGDEVGMQGLQDPFNRAPFPWGNEDKEILAYYKRMIRLRRENKVLVYGDLRVRETVGYAICFERSLGDTTARIFLNAGEEAVTLCGHEITPMSGGVVFSRSFQEEWLDEI